MHQHVLFGFIQAAGVGLERSIESCNWGRVRRSGRSGSRFGWHDDPISIGTPRLQELMIVGGSCVDTSGVTKRLMSSKQNYRRRADWLSKLDNPPPRGGATTTKRWGHYHSIVLLQRPCALYVLIVYVCIRYATRRPERIPSISIAFVVIVVAINIIKVVVGTRHTQLLARLLLDQPVQSWGLRHLTESLSP